MSSPAALSQKRVKEPSKDSQSGKILEELRAIRRVGGDWLCAITFQKMFIPTYSQRVRDLRRMGHTIHSRPCNDHEWWDHQHSGQVAMYMYEPPSNLFVMSESK